MGSAEKKFTVTEESDSKHPQDWGRAMAVAISRLVELAHEAGDVVEDENLYGEDLHLYLSETEDGANITISWTPRASASSASPEQPGQELG
ncbi:hypothetical protein ASH00_02445 [Arthrobacter sp. Soil782]|uniref:hypothetical protein n=1 Tax=Arthrobacter sp. Soil782 TaxID=1736410 RepID=UPI0006FC470D|nr:hypothetical protein [Arthrobacter sp. Soil782]KRF08586.1 hypothetical protein ASH00_02445 [Arthrobacter sp. Soil782]